MDWLAAMNSVPIEVGVCVRAGVVGNAGEGLGERVWVGGGGGWNCW